MDDTSDPRVYRVNHNDGRKAAKKSKKNTDFEPRRYTKQDESFAKRLHAGFRMLRGTR